MKWSDDREASLVAAGEWGIVEFAVLRNGSMPARRFIERLPPKEQVRFAVLFQLLAETGRIRNSAQFRKERGEIWAFKRGGIRISCFRLGNHWFLADGFVKKRRRWPPTWLRRSERIRLEHMGIYRGMEWEGR